MRLRAPRTVPRASVNLPVRSRRRAMPRWRPPDRRRTRRRPATRAAARRVARPAPGTPGAQRTALARSQDRRTPAAPAGMAIRWSPAAAPACSVPLRVPVRRLARERRTPLRRAVPRPVPGMPAARRRVTTRAPATAVDSTERIPRATAHLTRIRRVGCAVGHTPYLFCAPLETAMGTAAARLASKLSAAFGLRNPASPDQ